MARHHELTVAQHELLADLLPAVGKRGGRWNDHRVTLNGASSGGCIRAPSGGRGPSTMDPDRVCIAAFGVGRATAHPGADTRPPSSSPHRRGLARSHPLERGRHQHPRQPFGGRGAQKTWPRGEPDDHALGRSHEGHGTKLHLIVDGNGVLLAAKVSAGQAHGVAGWPPRWRACAARPRHGPAKGATAQTGRRQGLQLYLHPPLPGAPWHRRCYPRPNPLTHDAPRC